MLENWEMPSETFGVPKSMLIRLLFAPDAQVPSASTGGVAAPSKVAGVPFPLNTTSTL